MTEQEESLILGFVILFSKNVFCFSWKQMVPTTMGDESQNSWSSDPMQEFVCMTKACSSLFVFSHLEYNVSL